MSIERAATAALRFVGLVGWCVSIVVIYFAFGVSHAADFWREETRGFRDDEHRTRSG